MGQLGVPGASSVEGHEQDALALSARCMDELLDLFLTKNRRQATILLRIGSLGDTPAFFERLDVKEP